MSDIELLRAESWGCEPVGNRWRRSDPSEHRPASARPPDAGNAEGLDPMHGCPEATGRWRPRTLLASLISDGIEHQSIAIARRCVRTFALRLSSRIGLIPALMTTSILSGRCSCSGAISTPDGS